QQRIQRASGMEVMTERLFKDDTHPAMTLEESSPIEVFQRCRYRCGGEREIEHAVLRQISGDLQPAYECGEGLEIFRTPFVDRLVVKMIFTPLTQFVCVTESRIVKTFIGPQPKGLLAHFRQGRSHDHRILFFHFSVGPQMKQRGQELAPRQVAGGPENDKEMRLDGKFSHVAPL